PNRRIKVYADSQGELTPEQIFLTAVDDALDQRQAHRIDKLIRAAKLPIPQASIAEINYQDGRGITLVRMKRYAGHHWRQHPTHLLVLSPTGGGKTYLACAIGIAASQNGRRHRGVLGYRDHVAHSLRGDEPIRDRGHLVLE
ncbi:ATP-binding protein, partial [Dietzia lutea]